MSTYERERDAKRLMNQSRKIERLMAAPAPRGEVYSGMDTLQRHVVALALTLEALDTLLIKKGVLADDELIGELQELMKVKAAQMEASDAVEEQNAPRIEVVAS